MRVEVVGPAGPTLGSGQEADALVWWNPAASPFPVIEGQGWTKEVKAPYDRLPARAEKIVRKPVWALSRNATGLTVRFKTTARSITVHYAVKGKLNAPHFATTGMSGLDLYAVDNKGEWHWAPGKYDFGEKPGDTISYTFEISKADTDRETGCEYILYLPIYNTVDWLKIGTPRGALFEPLPTRAEKPIAIYGTSITQGACASRPGRAWPSIVGRALNTPVINLGFSGNGTLDP
ncbi:MAG: SGNH/GDSL hydrolase family protein, partial [Armatimonadota bacterium]